MKLDRPMFVKRLPEDASLDDFAEALQAEVEFYRAKWDGALDFSSRLAREGRSVDARIARDASLNYFHLMDLARSRLAVAERIAKAL